MARTGLQSLNIFLIIFPFLLSLTIVTLRVWKRIKERKYAIEDTLLVIAEALLLVLTATMWKFVLVSYAGYHAEDIPKGAIDKNDVYLWRYINNVIYNPILGLVKISFLITLLKLRCMDRLILASLWTLIIVNAIFVVGATLASFLMCLPLQKSWHPDVPGACGDRRSYIFGTISVTIATDILVAIIPAWVLYDLRIPLKHKVAVIIFLSLPIMVTVIGCYRLHKFVEVMNLKQISVENPYSIRSTLSNVEANLGVLAACGPTIKWILAKFIPYFNTSPVSDPHSPDQMDFPRQNPREQLNYEANDIEQHLHRLSVLYPYNSKSSDGKDSDSQKQCIMGEGASDMQETRVVECEPALSNKELHIMVIEPRTAL